MFVNEDYFDYPDVLCRGNDELNLRSKVFGDSLVSLLRDFYLNPKGIHIRRNGKTTLTDHILPGVDAVRKCLPQEMVVAQGFSLHDWGEDYLEQGEARNNATIERNKQIIYRKLGSKKGKNILDRCSLMFKPNKDEMYEAYKSQSRPQDPSDWFKFDRIVNPQKLAGDSTSEHLRVRNALIACIDFNLNASLEGDDFDNELFKYKLEEGGVEGIRGFLPKEARDEEGLSREAYWNHALSHQRALQQRNIQRVVQYIPGLAGLILSHYDKQPGTFELNLGEFEAEVLGYSRDIIENCGERRVRLNPQAVDKFNRFQDKFNSKYETEIKE